ncbi:hypothetical protein AB1A81_08775 [Bdellovibrio bacteriovorus]|uniref:Uncharacterized protein n=1 Tax=Bdellovibrio bacteriovorus (strain ATCC 15356 / DSM 50701 / NCIMB 9529 / HD100) TaxID=264462 RepID=Q6MLT1_BDEBA|nr:hypothetical protein [Bdellovibrio bacteriovorus]AHZ84422.1 hypothetical protein EP01_05670 [Bdellovibrio bacteriovorus]BEV68311.1 hypothetical protein Bb109J_c1731 [Bdellovibrio bacteriovorus]CAE79775.1 hypothetical protein, possible protease homolog [Bdellovibrio bacteriovorus HD100]
MATDGSKKDDKDNSGDLKGLLGDTVKKVFTAGVSAAFMTEESLRAYVSELKLPKEALNLLIQGAQKSKDEVTQRVTKEIVGIIQKIDFVKEASKFAETHKFKITAEIDIIKKDASSSKDESDEKA